MDPILALIVIEQTIATVVIAAAIVIYSRATTRILEAHVEPEVHVTVDGDRDVNSLTITNHAGCAISNLNVIISAGCIWDSRPYPSRHCLYFGAWQLIAAGSIEKPIEQPMRQEAFANTRLPNGAVVDTNDISVEYSFTRRADKRRYAFKYQLGVFKQPDGKLVYVRMGEPRMLSLTKAVCEEERFGASIAPTPETTVSDETGASLGAAAPCIG